MNTKRETYYGRLGIINDITYSVAFENILQELRDNATHYGKRVELLLTKQEQREKAKELLDKLDKAEVPTKQEKPPLKRHLFATGIIRQRSGSFAEHEAYSHAGFKLKQALLKKVAVFLPLVEQGELSEQKIGLKFEELEQLNAILQDILQAYFSYNKEKRADVELPRKASF